MSEWVTADTPLTHSLTHSLHWASVTHCTTTPSVHFGSFSLRQRTLSVQPQHCSLKHYQRPKSVYVHASMYTPYTVHRTPYIDAVPFTPSLTRPPSFPLIMQPYSTSTIHPFIWCSFCVLSSAVFSRQPLPPSLTHSPTHSFALMPINHATVQYVNIRSVVSRSLSSLTQLLNHLLAFTPINHATVQYTVNSIICSIYGCDFALKDNA